MGQYRWWSTDGSFIENDEHRDSMATTITEVHRNFNIQELSAKARSIRKLMKTPLHLDQCYSFDEAMTIVEGASEIRPFAKILEEKVIDEILGAPLPYSVSGIIAADIANKKVSDPVGEHILSSFLGSGKSIYSQHITPFEKSSDKTEHKTDEEQRVATFKE